MAQFSNHSEHYSVSQEIVGVTSLANGYMSGAPAEPCNNFTQRKIWALERSLRAAQETGDPVAIAIAHVRAEVLGLTHREYASQVSLSVHAIRNLEGKRGTHSHSQYDTYTRVLADWAERAERAHPSRLSEELKLARLDVLNGLVSADAGTSLGMLLKWRLEIGKKLFEEKTGLSSGTLWERRNIGALRPFHELITIAKKLEIVPADFIGRELWHHAALVEARDCWVAESVLKQRPRSVSLLHTLVNCVGGNCTAASFKDLAPDLRTIDAMKLANFEIVRWRNIGPILKALKPYRLMDEGLGLRGWWQSEYEKERQRPSAKMETRKLMAQQKFGPTALARVLGLPDDSSTTRESRRLVQQVINGDTFSPKAPFGIIAVLVSEDFNVVQALLSLRRDEIQRRMERKGALYCSPIQIERLVWGVGLTELPFSKALVQRMEWGRKVHGTSEQDLVDIVVKTGAARFLNHCHSSGIGISQSQRNLLEAISQHAYHFFAGTSRESKNAINEVLKPPQTIVREVSEEAHLPPFIKAKFPEIDAGTVLQHLEAIAKRTSLRADNTADHAEIVAHLSGLLDGTLTAAFYGDTESVNGPKNRSDLYELRAQLGFKSVFHEADSMPSLA